MKIDGYTRMAAVIAHPIRHSISPFIHNLAYELTATNAAYLAWDIAEEDLESTISQIRKLDMIGANISMPYKQKVFPYLDEVDEMARKIGSVNTIIHRNGKLKGYNTDGIGFFRSLPPAFSIKGKTMVLLGAGGAAKAILAQAILDGVSQVSVFVRSASMGKTQPYLEKLQHETGFRVELFALEDRQDLQGSITHADLVVNATSVGMDGVSLPIPASVVLPEKLLVADVIYQPFETPFFKWARSQGNHAVNGLGMLLYQAAEAFQLWTGKQMPTDQIWELLKQKYQ